MLLVAIIQNYLLDGHSYFSHSIQFLDGDGVVR